MRDVVRQLIEALRQDRELIVCQVVETRGSTPQKAGALMVIDPDGGQLGTLGGGCVENEVKMKAVRQAGDSAAAVHSFVLDHDYAWADGLICGGKMIIVTQSVRGPAPWVTSRRSTRRSKTDEASPRLWSSILGRRPARYWEAGSCSTKLGSPWPVGQSIRCPGHSCRISSRPPIGPGRQ